MGHELFSISRIGTKRVLWMMGLMFAMILALQYFELPYGFSLSSLLSAGKVSVIEEGDSHSPAHNPLSKTELVADPPLSDSINSTSSHDSYGMANYTEVFEEQRDDEFIPEEDHTLKEALELDLDANATKSSSTEDSIEPVENSTVDDESINNDLQRNNQSFDRKDDSLRNDSIGINGTKSSISTLGYSNHSGDNFAAPPAVPPISSSSMMFGNTSNISQNSSSHDVSVGSNAPAPNSSEKLNAYVKEKVEVNTSNKSEKTEQLHSERDIVKNKSVSEEKKVPRLPFSGVYTLSEMDSLLLESRASYSPIVSSKISCLSHNGWSL